MLREADLPLRIVETGAYLDFLGAQDEPWLRVVAGEVTRFAGRKRRQLAERLAEPLPCTAPTHKRRAACRVLMQLLKPGRLTGPRPALVREVVFTVAATARASRDRVLDETAAVFGIGRAALDEAMFADLPGEQVVRPPVPPPTVADIILRTNLAIAQAVLMRASALEVRMAGGARPIVRLAKLRGLLCSVRDSAPGEDSVLEVSGPLSLFRHTRLYGHALAELLPHLAWCGRFTLTARAALRGRLCEVTLDNHAPIFPARPPRPFDSQLEAKFAADFAALAPDWDIMREPEPVRAVGTLIFPDFLLQHRLHAERRVWVEIVGFWTPEYLAEKLARLRAANLNDLVLCIDQERACRDGDLPAGAVVVRYRRKIDAAAVLHAVQNMSLPTPIDRC